MRYFNVVGADRMGRLGENPKFEISHTYKRLWTACRSVMEGKQSCVSTNGDHIRDYVHVEDVATANIAAIEAPSPTTMTSSESNAKHFIWNVASNKGVTNRDFVETAERISGNPIPICKTDAGGGNNRTATNEAVGIFGSSDRLQATLGWKPQYLTLESMLATAYNYSYSQQRPQPSHQTHHQHQQQQPATRNQQPATSNQQPATSNQQQQQPDTVIVMFDTRTLDVNVSSDYIPHRWTADLNYQYAKRHGYDFVYVQPEVYFEDDAPAEAVTMETDGVNSKFKTRPTCHLNLPNGTKRGRGASWCRLLAVALMLERGYSTILFLDTDAAFLNHTLDLESLFPQIVQQEQEEGGGVAEDANLVWLPSNAPFNPHPRLPNGGMHIWRKPSIKSWRLIRQWWQLDIHPAIQCYEQDALWSVITGSLVAYPCGGVRRPLRINPKCGVGVLQYEWMRSELFHSLPLVHIPSVSNLISKRKDILQKEWREKVLDGKEMILKKNEVFEKVETLSGTEIERLQSILETRADNRIC